MNILSYTHDEWRFVEGNNVPTSPFPTESNCPTDVQPLSRYRQIYRSCGQGATILEFAKHGKPKIFCEISDFSAIDCGQLPRWMVCSRLLRLDRFGPKSAFSAGRANRVGSNRWWNHHLGSSSVGARCGRGAGHRSIGSSQVHESDHVLDDGCGCFRHCGSHEVSDGG